jgi:hypothetical protein
MKGHLYKKVMPSGWYVAYTADDFGFHKTELPLHPDDVNQIDEMSKIFDNVDARYHNQEVEFETVKKFMSDETLWFAKLINTKEKQKQETLYTEEQVKFIVEKSRETGLTAEYLMLSLKQPKKD